MRASLRSEVWTYPETDLDLCDSLALCGSVRVYHLGTTPKEMFRYDTALRPESRKLSPDFQAETS